MDTLNEAERRHQKALERLRLLRPFDDEFMRCLFRDNIPLAQFTLCVLTGRNDIVITKCETQKDMKRLGGARSLCLDLYAKDTIFRIYNMETQRESGGADPKRARYHSSVVDIENLNANQDFSELPETYIIFITETDFFGKGEPVYPIERINLATGEPFNDGTHILYVNGAYRGDSDIGKLMHDFSCASADDMNFRIMADNTRYLKENTKGVRSMCKVIEDMLREEREEVTAEVTVEVTEGIVREMLRKGKLSLEDIAQYSKLPLDKVKELQFGQ